jgi:short-subunit dehydrogenase
LVTGAAGGIGRCLAEQLHCAGHDLLVIDRDAERLAALARQLDCRALVADLATRDGAAAVGRRLEEEGLGIAWLINNAGIGQRGELGRLSLAAQQEVLELNCHAVLALSHLACRHFASTGRGTLINIASSAAFQPLPLMSVYAASKAFVLNLTEGLWGELRDREGIRVIAVCPAGTATGFQAAAGVGSRRGETLLRPETVAARIIRAASSRSPTVLIGSMSRIMYWMSLIPSRRLQATIWARMMGSFR